MNQSAQALAQPAIQTSRPEPFWGASFEQENVDLWCALSTLAPEQFKAVMQGCARVELEPGYMGMVVAYKRLAELIPPHWGVIDLGCSYAPQAWYFRRHAFYIGVDFAPQDVVQAGFGPATRFAFDNTKHFHGSIDQYLDTDPVFDVPVFAIMNYVPANGAVTRRVRETFPDLFVFYPKSQPNQEA
jgi:hypothetical protein